MNELKSLQELFFKKIFRIPDYQRGYSWSLQQLEEFWSDVINLILDQDHYIGMVSLKELTKEETQLWSNEQWLLNDSYKAYHIVDGQQRLTTITILINEIINYVILQNPNKNFDDIYINKTRVSDLIRDYLYMIDPESDNITKTYKFGYEVDNPSNKYFKHKILGEKNEGQIEETFYTTNLLIAKNFFIEKIEELVKKSGINALECLFKKITQKLKFNIYYINDDFNVFIAFETMNNRGKPLSYLELLKNRLIYLSTLFSCADYTKENLRKEINEAWKTIYSYLGKNKDKPLNDNEFLQNHWMIYFKYTRSNQVTYNTYLLNDYFTQQNIFKENLVKINTEYNDLIPEENDIIEVEEDSVEISNASDTLSIGDINNYILSLKNLSVYWYNLHNPSEIENPEIKLYVERLNRLGFGNFKPLATVVLSKDDISDADKVAILKGMERFVFLHYRLNGYFSTYKNSFFYLLAHKLYLNEIKCEDVINEVNKIDYLSDNNVIASSGVIDKFSKLFNGVNKGFYSWASLRYVLYEYERYLMYGKGTIRMLPEDIFKTDKKDTCSIEHVYPQTPTDEYWLSNYKEFDDKQKYMLNGSLGNLLPLSKSINSSLQNIDFNSKVNGINRFDLDGIPRGYKNGSYNELEVSNYTIWNAESILDRGLKIVKFMEDEWQFHFQNKSDKIKFLGLEFLIKNNDEYIDVYEPEYYDEKDNHNQKEIKVDTLEDLLQIMVEGVVYGYGYYMNGGILVKKGTKLRLGIVAANDYMQNKIDKARKNPKIVNDVFIEDEFYTSPSLAANVILGNNKNGWSYWRNQEGKALNELVRK